MGRYTLRMPKTLHERLELLAKNEGVSLNQFIVYSLTQQVSRSAYVFPVSADEVEQQHKLYGELIAELGQVSDEEFDTILAEGEEPGFQDSLTPEIIAKVEAKIAQKQH